MIDRVDRIVPGWARACLRPARRVAECLLTKSEPVVLRKHRTPKWAPIFIIGLPRSGTTLLYQVMVRHFALAYFCNLAARFRFSPGIVTNLLARGTTFDPPSSFASYYGETEHWSGPNQGQGIWARWFGDAQGYVDRRGITPTALSEIRGTISLVEKAFCMPFVNKSIGHSVRIRALDAAFPNALFLHVVRNRLDVARSILRGREEYFGSAQHWFSVRPREYEQIKDGDAIDQVCRQMYYVDQNIASDAEAIGHDRFLTVRYEELCSAAHEILYEIGEFYHRRTGTRLSRRHEVPLTFSVSQRPHSLDSELQKLIAELWPPRDSVPAPICRP